jgi:Ser/Thr protein kinase RdoA (MazF antagonist)
MWYVSLKNGILFKDWKLIYVRYKFMQINLKQAEREDIKSYETTVKISETHLLPIITELYALNGYEIKLINAHECGRNVVYVCENAAHKVIRISFLDDRNREDFLAETEYVRYLYEHGGSVSNVINSRNGNLLEEIIHNHHKYFVCVFEKAKGKQLAENGYQYREGVPITEYFYNCGKTLGKLHQLSKEYSPTHKRKDYFDKFNVEYVNKLIPDSLSALKEKLYELIKQLDCLCKSRDMYGMIHFDFSDGNYNIDFDTGQITVYDFDNSCFGWYLYDLANLWVHGTGWIQHEDSAEKRKAFMGDYFNTIIEGYRSEANISDSMLEMLPLLINAVLMENIVDEFEAAKINGEEIEYDEEILFLIKCLVDDIPYKGFFSEIM